MAALATPTDIRFDETSFWVSLSDGRTLGVPLSWFPPASAGKSFRAFEVHAQYTWSALGRTRRRYLRRGFAGWPGGMRRSAPDALPLPNSRDMSTLTLSSDPLATDFEVTDVQLKVTLEDGRELAAPLAWYPRLRDVSPAARQNWRLIGRGEGIHWPEIDEDISVLGLLAGWGNVSPTKGHAAA